MISMMRIESVAAQPDRVGRYTVKFDDGSVMRLYRQTVEDFGLYAGREFSSEELKNLRTAAEEVSAKMRAVRIVSASSVSKSDLERRLVQKGESKKDAVKAVEWMSQMGLIDDEKTAQQIIQHCISKGYGPARARQALYEKQIPKEYWDAALADYPEQTDKILSFLTAHLGNSREQKDIRRVTDALLRRGHSYTQIRKALQQYLEDLDPLEEEYG